MWALGLPVTLAVFVAILATRPFDRTGRAAHSIGALWCRIILALSGVRVEVRGAEKVPRGEPVILASNHQGAFDIPTLQAHLPIQFRWVAKKSLFSIPVVGWSMTLAGYIPIERESATKAYRSMLEAAKKIRSGTTVVIFPEGTRSATGELGAFKRGGFTLAVKAGVPVVPVAITGTKDVMRKGSLLIRPARVAMTFADPIPTEGKSEKELMALTREAIETIL
ncbi:MAG TPA: lysophospholipid acyltransferase family protein [Gammaproteobacteria bacterium]|nr:lysophospholipid acyltransferase family protein [Gammaproteobacteria bacterium]